jgi:hypothetical protein
MFEASTLAIILLASICFVGFGLFRQLPNAYDMGVFIALSCMSVLTLSPDPTDVVIMLLFIFGVSTGYLKIYVFSRARGVVIAFAVFLAFFVVSALVGVGLRGELDLTHFSYIFVKIAFCLFFWLYVTSHVESRIVFVGYLATAVFASSLVFLGISGLSAWSAIMPAAGEVRFAALMSDPNVLGAFLVPPVIWLLDEIVSPKLSRGFLIVKLIALPLIALASIVTLSRGAWLNLSISVTLYLLVSVLKGDVKKASIILVVVLAVVGAGIFVTFETDYSKWIMSRTELAQGDLHRFDVQSAGVIRSFDQVFGFGPGQSVHTLGMQPHNLFVQVLVDNGLFCLCALAFLILHVTFLLIRNIQKNIHFVNGLSAQVLFASWIGLLANAMVIDVLYWRVFWLLLGLSLAQGNDNYLTGHSANSRQIAFGSKALGFGRSAHARDQLR